MKKTTEDDHTPGGRIRIARKRMRLTSEKMAKAIHISRGYLSELENGKAEVSDKVLRAMEVELVINPEYVRNAVLPVFLDVKKFTLQGKQVAESVTGGAFAEGVEVREGAPADYAAQASEIARKMALGQPIEEGRTGILLKPESLRLVIQVVMEQLERAGLKLPPAKLAELVVLIYEHLAGEDVEEDQVKRTANRYLRLVA